LTPINLTSIMIGNGLTDFTTMFPAYFDLQCTPASVYPIQDINTCIRMKEAIPRCRKWMKESCVDVLDSMNCEAAVTFCQTELMTPFFNSGKNPYDITRDCEGDIADTLCYPVTKIISKYLSKPKVRTILGVDPIVGNFSACSDPVNAAFTAALDEYHPTYLYVAALLERDIRVLVYVGKNDWICNWVGNERWTLALEWSGGDAFQKEELRDWTVAGEVAGSTRGKGGLTFATVNGAGHMVPYDKPQEALQLVNRWLAGESL